MLVWYWLIVFVLVVGFGCFGWLYGVCCGGVFGRWGVW